MNENQYRDYTGDYNPVARGIFIALVLMVLLIALVTTAIYLMTHP